MAVENGSPATIRDVYDAVNDVRDELGVKIDNLSAIVNTVAVSHEHRLTVLEQIQTIHDARMTVAEAEIKKHSDELAGVNAKFRADEALNSARAHRTMTFKWIIGTIVAAAGTTSGIILVLH